MSQHEKTQPLHNRQSAERSRPRSYRVRNIPLSCNVKSLRKGLELGLRLPAGAELIIHSLSTDFDFGAQAISRTATISIRFEEIEDQDSQVLPPYILFKDENSIGTTELLIDSQFNGLTPLSPFEEDEQHTAVCIAVHGWGGHAIGSFQAEEDTFLWLRDRLPQLFPQLQIWTYGYGSSLRDGDTVQDMFGYSREFENAIIDLYKMMTVCCILIESWAELAAQMKKSDIPVFFIAHSLGGMVTIVDLSRSASGRHIIQLIYAIFFFGVPSQGINTSALATMIGDKPQRYNLALLDSTVGHSLRQRLHSEFCDVFPFEDSKIYQFYEALQTKTVTEDPTSGIWTNTGSSQLLVSRESALSGRPWETSSDYVIEVKSDHRNMVKFRRGDRESIAPVLKLFREALQVCTDTIGRRGNIGQEESDLSAQTSNAQLETECFASLTFEQIGSRYSNIANAQTDTCRWLLEDFTYRTWWKGETPHKFLWIKGNPGVGKSTLMKEAVLAARNQGGATITSFFFNARGSPLERSVLGLFRSILCQFGLVNFQVKDRIVSSFLELKALRLARVEWSIYDLKAILLSACRDDLIKNCFIFIDALDEGDDDEIRSMLSYFRELTQFSGNDIRICLASRYYPHIRFTDCLELSVETRAGHTTDIQSYVHRQLAVDRQGADFQMLVNMIVEKSNGIFLWVVLVVKRLNKASDAGWGSRIEHILNETPSELSELFSDILATSEHSLDETLLLFQWILFAKRPLHPLELYFAVISELHGVYQLDDFARISEPEKFILDCSRGLVEITSKQSTEEEVRQSAQKPIEDFFGYLYAHPHIYHGDQVGNQTVQFIHGSVRDFLLRNEFPSLVNSKPVVESFEKTNDRLKEICFTYLTNAVNQMQSMASDEAEYVMGSSGFKIQAVQQFPLLLYSYSFVLSHAEDAIEACPQSNFVDRFSLGRESYSHFNYLRQIFDRLFTPYDILNTMCHFGLPKLARVRLSAPDVDVNSRTNSLRTPLHLAVKRGLTDIVRILLQHPDVGVNAVDKRGFSVLAQAVISDKPQVIDLLLASDRLNVSSRDSKGNTCVHLAALYDRPSCLKHLLSRPTIDINTANRRGYTPLILAAEYGATKCVQFLLERPDVELHATNYNGSTALAVAVIERNRNCVKQLLAKASLNVNMANRRGETALMLAVREDASECAALLLERGDIDLHATNNEGKDALTIAGDMGRYEIGEMIVQRIRRANVTR